MVRGQQVAALHFLDVEFRRSALTGNAKGFPQEEKGGRLVRFVAKRDDGEA